jgi:urease accessory protein
MIRAIQREPGGARKDAVVDEVMLDFDQRHRRRIAMQGKRGLSFVLDLAQTTRLQHGDALVLEDGRRVAVVAAPEPLYQIHAHGALALARIAWHLGNRHTPAEITVDAIYIQPDHVLAEMVAGLGAHVHEVMRPFEPEGGAYEDHGSGGHGHHHHGHGSDHEHGHHHHAGSHAHDHDDRGT